RRVVTRGLAIGLGAAAAGFGTCGSMLLFGGQVHRAAMCARGGLGLAGRVVDEILAPLRRAGAEGHDATRRERRRLQAAWAGVSFPVALVLADPIPAVAIATASALLAPRALVWRRERYTRRL